MNVRTPALLFALALLSGCASLQTQKTHYAGIGKMLATANYSSAITRVEAAKTSSYARKDRVVYYLDLGMLLHWNREYSRSNEMLELAERAIEENFTKSLSRSASSLIMNDNAMAYSGEAYEDIYLNAFKALNYLALNQPDQAFVEVRRINNKLAELESKYSRIAEKLSEAEEAQKTFSPGKNHFIESALGRYLSMILYRNEGKWDDVRIDLEKIARSWKLQPDIHPFKRPDFSRSTKQISPPLARLNILAFTGRAPDKKAHTFYIHTEENLIVFAGSSENYLGKQNLDHLNGLPWPGISAGYHFKLQLPSMEPIPSKADRVEVEIEGLGTESLHPIESLQNAATETFSINKPLIFTKTITRAVAKGLAAEKAKQKMTENMEGGMAFFTRLAADLLVDTTENADLRISRFFPARADIREIHLPAGNYTIRIHYYSADGTRLHTDERTAVHIGATQLNVLESAYLN